MAPKPKLADIDISQFTKEKPSVSVDNLPWTTSVKLQRIHERYLHSKGINFSEFVRAILDASMKKENFK